MVRVKRSLNTKRGSMIITVIISLKAEAIVIMKKEIITKVERAVDVAKEG
jgi:hypothetical protein